MAQVFYGAKREGIRDGDIVWWDTEDEREHHGVWWEGKVIEFDEMMPECVKIRDTNGFTPYHWFQKAHVSNYIRLSDAIVSRIDFDANECEVMIGDKEYTVKYSACGDGEEEVRFWVERDGGPIFYSYF